MIPEIKRVKGVGDANVLGQDYSMRIWLKPDVMAQYKLVPTDVSAALAEQNIEAAPGQFGERGNQTFQYTIRYKGLCSKRLNLKILLSRPCRMVMYFVWEMWPI